MGPRPAVSAAPAEQQHLPEKINLDDGHALKYKLDATATEVILQSGYVEDHLISNVKIALGLIAIVVAVYSHFGPGKFPANWNTVLYCVAAYCVLNLVLLIFCNIKEGDSFLTTHPKLVRVGGQVSAVTYSHQHPRHSHAHPAGTSSSTDYSSSSSNKIQHTQRR
eukprot:GHRQ01013740.1.p1 GENE.GHRQ01013740.1~~GHRQ01013740.1.p1  ORF type:complete len:165 (+),score=60.79 GHRQ01013740.1:415-909(+)